MESLNLTVALGVTQLFLLVIVACGLGILRVGETALMLRTPLNHTLSLLHQLLWFALLTLGLLFLSEDIFAKANPVFGSPAVQGLTTKKVFDIVFAADLVCGAWLIRETGGPRYSPFAGVLFLLPTIAIFLREPPSRFIFYALVAGLLFMVAFIPSRRWDHYRENEMGSFALMVVTCGCLGVATLLGWATRPL